MAKNRRKKIEDTNETAHRVVAEATGGSDKPLAKPKAKRKNPAAVALGRMGGKVGGRARAEALSAARRSEIARKAARERWAKTTEGTSKP